MTTEVRVPTLGESVAEATVATWFKQPGDAVAVDEMLCELETDKVTVEVPSPVAGTLAEIIAKEGETVTPDALLAQIAEGDAPAKPAASAATASESAEPASGGAAVPVEVPSLGESVSEAIVATWFKKPGDAVTADEMLCELETDKVSVEVPAPVSGVLAEILVEEGGTVEAGGRLGTITEGAAGSAAKTAAVDSPGAGPETVTPRAGADIEDAPSARKAMAEQGIARDQVTGTGKDGRVMKEDVARAAAAPATPARDTGPREERVRMTRLRQTIARRLKEAQNTAAMLTTYNEADMSAVMDLRRTYKDEFEKKHGARLGFMSFFVKACAHALAEVPNVNAEIDGDSVIYKNYVNMGVAVGTPQGLVVPVIRDVQDMSFAAIEKAIADAGLRARDGKLSMDDMQGGTFTISNGGVYGSLLSSPILNPPQSGILGMHKIQERPVVVGGEIVIRPMMYLALSYDHRIVDGQGAVTFLVRVKEALEDPQRLLMDL